MVSALISRLSGPLAGDVVLCSWSRHLTLTVPLPTQVYKWVLANLMLGVTLRWTGIPSRGSLHATETGDKCWPDGPLGPNADLTYKIVINYLLWACNSSFKKLSFLSNWVTFFGGFFNGAKALQINFRTIILLKFLICLLAGWVGEIKWRGVWKKALSDFWSHVKFFSSVQGSEKHFATEILPSIRCYLESFSMHPFKYGLIAAARGAFTSQVPISPNRKIVSCHETMWDLWYTKIHSII